MLLTTTGTAPRVYNPRKIPNSLRKLRARVRSVKETKNTLQWLTVPKNTIRQWSRTPKCDPIFSLSMLVFFSSVGCQWETLLNDRILAFGSPPSATSTRERSGTTSASARSARAQRTASRWRVDRAGSLRRACSIRTMTSSPTTT